MDKARLEAISDGVFAVVMTLLVFNIHLPTNLTTATDAQLWYLLGRLWPNFVSYALSFLVLSVFWINHHYLFSLFVKQVDRYLNLMNMVFLLFLAFVPFSAELFGTFPYNKPAALLYGLNILAIVIMTSWMFRYARKHAELEEHEPRTIMQAQIRQGLTTISYVIGIALSFIYIPACVFFYPFPMIFNIIPGTLGYAEKIFRFEIG